MADNTKRFTGKGALYAEARPRYAEPLFAYLAEGLGLAPGARIADVGSGTGIFSAQLLDHGWHVTGVEPNDDMRAQAERALAGESRFASVRGTASDTGLPAASAACVTAAQAFHWFDADEFKRECRRILAPGGAVAIVYNVRDADSPYTRTYADLRRRFDPAFRGFSNGLDESAIEAFFDGACEVRSWDNAHPLGREAFVRRGLSSSNAPMEGDPRFEECVEALGELFDRFSEVRAEGGGARRVLTIPLRTVVHAGRL